MTATEPIVTALQRNWELVDSALAGLDDADLARRPNDQSNSVAWIMWHMNRVMDTFIHTRLQQIPQLWVRDGWHQKHDMSDDPDNRGVGWTAEQVAAWTPPSREVMLGYYEAVKADAVEYFSSLTAADLEKRMVILPVAEPRSVANASGHIISEIVAHGGQIAYLRGLHRGMGWSR